MKIKFQRAEHWDLSTDPATPVPAPRDKWTWLDFADFSEMLHYFCPLSTRNMYSYLVRQIGDNGIDHIAEYAFLYVCADMVEVTCSLDDSRKVYKVETTLVLQA